jgi:hypothetical protein
MCLNFSVGSLGWNVRPRLYEIQSIPYEVVENAVVLRLHRNVKLLPLLVMDHLKNC